MKKFTIKGISSSKDKPTTASVTRTSMYMKKGKKMMKGDKMKKGDKMMMKGSKIVSKSGGCGCGGSMKKKMQTGGYFGKKPIGMARGLAAGTTAGLIKQQRAKAYDAIKRRKAFSPTTLKQAAALSPLTPANDPRNSHNPKDPWANTNLSVGGGTPPVKLSMPGRALTGYVQGNSINGVPSINYTGPGVSRYSGRSNQGALAKYLGNSNPNLKSVVINGKLVTVRR